MLEFNIVDEAAAARQQFRIFETLDGAADERVSDGVIADGLSAKCHRCLFYGLDPQVPWVRLL